MATVLFALLLLVELASSSAITAATEYPRARLRRQSTDTAGPEVTSCGPWVFLESSCAAATPGFTLLTAFASQASCLCYSSSAWAPQVYDSALATCLSFLSTASPAYYTSLDGAALPRTPCAEVASIVGPGATGGASGAAMTTSASGDPNYSACLSWESISSTCDAKTPGFATLQVSAEDNCLCYTSGTYAPSIFDGYWESCLTYYSTASPAFYSSSLGGDGGIRSPCALAPATATASTSTGPPMASGTSRSTANSGAVVTSSGPSPTTTPPPSSAVLTTTLPTTTSSSGGGNGAMSSAGGALFVATLFVGMLAVILVL